MLSQPSYSPNITTADFFLFQRDDVKLADLSLSQGGFLTNLEGVVQTSNKMSPRLPFGMNGLLKTVNPNQL
jgi:hypothetical protein